MKWFLMVAAFLAGSLIASQCEARHPRVAFFGLPGATPGIFDGDGVLFDGSRLFRVASRRANRALRIRSRGLVVPAVVPSNALFFSAPVQSANVFVPGQVVVQQFAPLRSYGVDVRAPGVRVQVCNGGCGAFFGY